MDLFDKSPASVSDPDGSLLSALQELEGDGSNWFERTFDSTGYEARFNREENEKDRQFSANQAAMDREFNSQQAQIQREFEERLSNTAYQRAYADMQAAGLNPYLMYGHSGASTPAVASPTASGARASAGRGLSAPGNAATLSAIVGLVSSAFSLGSSLYGSKTALRSALIRSPYYN